MDALDKLINGNDNNLKDIVVMALVLVIFLGLGKDSNFSLFNNERTGKSKHHNKHKKSSCSSSGG